MILGLDPDTHHTGYALLDDEGRVIKVGLIRIPTVVKNGKRKAATEWQSVTMMCHRITFDLSLAPLVDNTCLHEKDAWIRTSKYKIDAAFVEVPILRSASKARPDDIIRLGHVAGACLGAASMVATHVQAVEPKTWKGDVPKDIHQARILRDHPVDWTLYRDIPPSMRSHCIDAVGIAAWGLRETQVHR